MWVKYVSRGPQHEPHVSTCPNARVYTRKSLITCSDLSEPTNRTMKETVPECSRQQQSILCENTGLHLPNDN